MSAKNAHPVTLAVKLYRRTLGRRSHAAPCLFAVPCSQHVQDVADTDGFAASVRAAIRRWRACRPGYEFGVDERSWWITCADGSVHNSAELSTEIHEEALVFDYLIALSALDIQRPLSCTDASVRTRRRPLLRAEAG